MSTAVQSTDEGYPLKTKSVRPIQTKQGLLRIGSDGGCYSRECLRSGPNTISSRRAISSLLTKG